MISGFFDTILSIVSSVFSLQLKSPAEAKLKFELDDEELLLDNINSIKSSTASTSKSSASISPSVDCAYTSGVLIS